METDDAVDLLLELDDERREPSLALLPEVQRRRCEALLGYAPATAGGLMSPDFVCVYGQATVGEALERVRRARRRPRRSSVVFVMNTRRRLQGGDRAGRPGARRPGRRSARSRRFPARVSLDADLEEVARLMTDYDLTIVAGRRRRRSGCTASSPSTTCSSSCCRAAGAAASAWATNDVTGRGGAIDACTAVDGGPSTGRHARSGRLRGRPRLPAAWRVASPPFGLLGPGLIAANAGNDAGGIATYSSVGAGTATSCSG